MIKLAEFDGLTYTFDKIKEGKHLIVVTDLHGKSAEIFLEDAITLNFTLAYADLHKAVKEIRNFRQDFLDYIEECTN